ncbi:Trm112 family protein [Pseudoxanthomonas indica]|uniref:Uncharacterized conserved protein YbaR, Trm112 family n=1 Tax=Pseudoxanthomonas indica TaxID=428993 RepID=A0A1T5JHR7_9GAMM|nr:Trm112 family protein [Pseudoxanthomonas indica]GGD58829.1 hypothetical protein GCM10007235_33880 [Pseudoxanthomonas indica]SKC50906.1 Uncharacterized conserved protein YbaR, Trm112 family [Pseudoxanthomonas indica]
MDRKLLDILCCPTTRQSLSLLDSRGLEVINRAISAGAATRSDGATVSAPLREALLTQDRKTIYRVEDGIPVLLAEEAIATAQFADFPGK